MRISGGAIFAADGRDAGTSVLSCHPDTKDGDSLPECTGLELPEVELPCSERLVSSEAQGEDEK